MVNKLLAGIDIGTTGAKTGLFDLEGNLISSGYVEYSCSYPKPNWVEQDANILTESAMKSAKEALNNSGINPRNIAAIAFSTQRTCSIFIDKSGNPLRPIISWQDNRTTEEVEEINSKINSSEYYKITGLPINTTWILSKILWLRKNFKILNLKNFIFTKVFLKIN